MFGLICKVFLDHWKPFWSAIRWGKQRKEEAVPFEDVLSDEYTMTQMLKSVNNHFKWEMDDASQLWDSYQPIEYLYNRYVDTKSTSDKFVDDCFTGDTKIKCLDGNSYTFKELVDKGVTELWVYSCLEDGTIIPAKAIFPRAKETTKQLVKITLDSGDEVKCTEDHLFMMRDGSYKRAKDITPEDSLMPGYFKVRNDGYLLVKDNKEEKFIPVHTMVNAYCHMEELESARNRLNTEKYHNDVVVTHHIDHNKTNNLPSNLCWKTWREHSDEHLIEYNKSEQHRESARILGPKNGIRRLISYNKSEEHKKTVASMNRDGTIKDKQLMGKILSVASKAIAKFGCLDEATFNSCLIPGCLKYDKALCKFENYEEFYELAKSYNHKVTSIEKIGNEIVYDITVPGTNNFLIDAGVFVHNCDGCHSVVYHILKNNGYDCVLFTIATRPITQAHTMVIYKENGCYTLVNYRAVTHYPQGTTIQDIVDDYNKKHNLKKEWYWNMHRYDYDKNKFYTVDRKDF